MGLFDDLLKDLEGAAKAAEGAVSSAVRAVESAVGGGSNARRTSADSGSVSAQKAAPSAPNKNTASSQHNASYASGFSSIIYSQPVLENALSRGSENIATSRVNYDHDVVVDDNGAAVDLTTRQSMRASDAKGDVVAVVRHTKGERSSGGVSVVVPGGKDRDLSTSVAHRVLKDAATIAKALSNGTTEDAAQTAAALSAKAAESLAKKNVPKVITPKVVNQQMTYGLLSESLTGYYKNRIKKISEDAEVQEKEVMLALKHDPRMYAYLQEKKEIEKEYNQYRQLLAAYTSSMQHGDVTAAKEYARRINSLVPVLQADVTHFNKVTLPAAQDAVDDANFKLAVIRKKANDRLINLSAKLGTVEGTGAVADLVVGAYSQSLKEIGKARSQFIKESFPMKFFDSVIFGSSAEGATALVKGAVQSFLKGDTTQLKNAEQKAWDEYLVSVQKKGNLARAKRILESPVTGGILLGGAGATLETVAGEIAGRLFGIATTSFLVGETAEEVRRAAVAAARAGKLKEFLARVAPSLAVSAAMFTAGDVAGRSFVRSIFKPAVVSVRTEAFGAGDVSSTSGVIMRIPKGKNVALPKELQVAADAFDNPHAVVLADATTTVKMKLLPNPANPLVRGFKAIDGKIVGKISSFAKKIFKPQTQTKTHTFKTLTVVADSEDIARVDIENPSAIVEPVKDTKISKTMVSVKAGEMSVSGEYIPLFRKFNVLEKGAQRQGGIDSDGVRSGWSIFRRDSYSLVGILDRKQRSIARVFTSENGVATKEGVTSVIHGKVLLPKSDTANFKEQASRIVDTIDVAQAVSKNEAGELVITAKGRLGGAKYSAEGLFRERSFSQGIINDYIYGIPGKKSPLEKGTRVNIFKLPVLEGKGKKGHATSWGSGGNSGKGKGELALLKHRPRIVLSTAKSITSAVSSAASASAAKAKMLIVQEFERIKAPKELGISLRANEREAPVVVNASAKEQYQVSAQKQAVPPLQLAEPSRVFFGVGKIQAISPGVTHVAKEKARRKKVAASQDVRVKANIKNILSSKTGIALKQSVRRKMAKRILGEQAGQFRSVMEEDVRGVAMQWMRVKTLQTLREDVRIRFKPAAPPTIPILFALREGFRGIRFSSGSKGSRSRSEKINKGSGNARKGKATMFVRPTLPVADWMIAHFGRVIVPKDRNVIRAYERWSELPIGNFNPLKYVPKKELNKILRNRYKRRKEVLL